MMTKPAKKVAAGNKYGLVCHWSTGGLLDLVLAALHAARRFPLQRPHLDLPNYFHRDNLADLYLEERPDGWVANVAFAHVPPGLPNTVGTPDVQPFRSERDAFLAGAAMVCVIVTGSPELPLSISGDRLITVAC